jgi:hypothetical protein
MVAPSAMSMMSLIHRFKALARVLCANESIQTIAE